jgi:hypothetical protein
MSLIFLIVATLTLNMVNQAEGELIMVQDTELFCDISTNCDINITDNCVTSDNYGSGGKYAPLQCCNFGTNTPGFINVTHFDVESSLFCQYDYLEVNGQKYCGDVGDLQKTPVDSSTQFRWNADQMVQLTGFKICVLPYIMGCTDQTYPNYDPNANTDDGSCIYVGCTYQSASNYLGASTDDGSCIYVGCMDPYAINYNKAANVEDRCDYAGCMDSTANNYDSSAIYKIPDSCWWDKGCTDPNADNYQEKAQNDDGSCVYSGCMDSEECGDSR